MNTQRITKDMASGDRDAYNRYLLILLRGQVSPDWQSLFKYWLSENCRSCKGTGIDFPNVGRGLLTGSHPCRRCNGLKKASLTCTLSTHLQFTLDALANPYQTLVWAYVASSDHNFRVDRLLAREALTVNQHSLRLAYAVYRFLRKGLPMRRMAQANMSGLLHIAVGEAINAGLIQRVREFHFIVPNNDKQPKIRALEALRNMRRRSHKPWLKRNHWLLSHLYQRGRIVKFTRTEGETIWAQVSSNYRALPKRTL